MNARIAAMRRAEAERKRKLATVLANIQFALDSIQSDKSRGMKLILAACARTREAMELCWDQVYPDRHDAPKAAGRSFHAGVLADATAVQSVIDRHWPGQPWTYADMAGFLLASHAVLIDAKVSKIRADELAPWTALEAAWEHLWRLMDRKGRDQESEPRGYQAGLEMSEALFSQAAA